MAAPVPSEAERGALLSKFETGPAHTRALGRLRQALAVFAALASLAVWLGRLPMTIALVASLGTLVALAWWRMGTQEVRRSSGPPDGLWLYQHGLLRRETGALRWLAWKNVARVSIDEERLRIRVHCPGSNDLYIACHYPGHALEEVAQALAHGAGVPGPYEPSREGSQSPHDDLQ